MLTISAEHQWYWFRNYMSRSFRDSVEMITQHMQEISLQLRLITAYELSRTLLDWARDAFECCLSVPPSHFSEYVKDLSAPTGIFRENIKLPKNDPFFRRSPAVCLKIYSCDFKYKFHLITFTDFKISKSTLHEVSLHLTIWIVLEGLSVELVSTLEHILLC